MANLGVQKTALEAEICHNSVKSLLYGNNNEINKTKRQNPVLNRVYYYRKKVMHSIFNKVMNQFRNYSQDG